MYLGNQPALSYTSFAKQDFSTSATTSYSLDHPVANANELALFINFVRQEPTTAYSASGTSLTLTSATASSDDMYCVYLGKAVQTVNPPNASVGLSQLTATGTKDATTFLRGDNTFAEAGGGSLNLISAQTASSASTLTFTSSHITSTYKVYQLHCIDVVQSSDGGNLGFEVSPNNGSSYVQSGYLNIRFYSNQTNGANSILSSAGTGDTNVKICGAGEGIGANGNESAQSIITLFNPLGAKAKLFKSDGVQLNSSGQLSMQRHLYGLDQSATYNNIKIVPNSGTFSGTFILYGVTAS